MASLLSPRRTRDDRGRGRGRDIELTATIPIDVERPPNVFGSLTGPRHGWVLIALGGSMAGAALGWVLISGLAVVGWLSADPGGFTGALSVGTELWLATNGVGASIAGTAVTLTPLGSTLIWILVLGRFARAAARSALRSPGVVTGDRPGVRTWQLTGLAVLGYVVVLVAGTFAAGLATGAEADLGARLLRTPVAGVLIAGPVSFAAAARALGYQPTANWPRWLRALPSAVGIALGVLLATGAAALTAALLLHLNRVESLWRALDAGLVGGIVLLVLQLAYLPNAVVWAAAYTLGSGFGLGTGSLVAPRATDLGLLPSLPMLGALPAEGPGSVWQLAWLAGGIVAGAAAALVVVRRGRIVRPDLGALAGGLAGVGTGLLTVGLAWMTRGSWGAGRLADLGPDLLALLVIAPVTLGLAGTVAGLFAGLVAMVAATRAARRDA
ncbi:MAG: cell division protein PerM [Propionibacteriaceae bacterium]